MRGERKEERERQRVVLAVGWSPDTCGKVRAPPPSFQKIALLWLCISSFIDRKRELLDSERDRLIA